MTPGRSGVHLAAIFLLVLLVPPWVIWTLERTRSRRARIALLLWIGAVGGALASVAPISLVFIGIAASGEATSFPLASSVWMAAVGPIALVVGSEIHGRTQLSVVAAAAAAALAGLIFGLSRRQMTERAEQLAHLQFERERAELEHERSEVLAERNRLAREIHDVLAHTLGALSIQLEALSTVQDADPPRPDEVRDGIRRTRSLAVEGLNEARRAVKALREDQVPLLDQLTALCERSGAELHTEGEQSPLSPEVGLAIYRAVQESLTNAIKHAPGAPVKVNLAFGTAAVCATVDNDASGHGPGILAELGSGYGLQGISERVRLLGGEVYAGPQGAVWQVRVSIPI
jgi:signal transduction histidine kinase